MKYLFLFILLLTSTISDAAPSNDDMLIKQQLITRISQIQDFMNSLSRSHYQFTVDNYEMGDKTSTAFLTLSLTSYVTNKTYTRQVKLNITHGPQFMLNNTQATGLALVSFSYDLSQDALQSSSENSQNQIQFNSIIDMTSPDWKIDINGAGDDSNSLFNWNDLKGYIIFHIANSTIIGSSIEATLQRFTLILHDKLQLNLQPIHYKAEIAMQNSQNIHSSGDVNSNGLSIDYDTQALLKVKYIDINDVTDVKNNIVSFDIMLGINDIEASALSSIGSIKTANFEFKLNDVNYPAYKDFYINAYKAQEFYRYKSSLDTNTMNDTQSIMANQSNPIDMTSAILALLTPTSNSQFASYIATDIGLFSSAGKFSLNTLPKTSNELLNSIDANIMAHISGKLLDTILAAADNFTKKMGQSQQPVDINASDPPMNMDDTLSRLTKEGILLPEGDGYSFTFTKQNQEMKINGNAQNPYLNMLQMMTNPPVQPGP